MEAVKMAQVEDYFIQQTKNREIRMSFSVQGVFYFMANLR
jgi:hypothetical protein